MNIRDYKSGTYVQQSDYKSFTPSPINTEWAWDDPKINTLLSEADRQLGGLRSLSSYVPDVDSFISLHVVKEATTSSRIEGTKTEMEEVLRNEADVSPENRDDRTEVLNYVDSMNYAIGQLETLPVSNRLLKETHKILLLGVRGKDKSPGEFRTSQNFIGGATIKDAVFIPPLHTEVPDLMSDLEKFLHNENINVPPLIRIAIAHYQFETIHPFADGNGRMGRLLITLYLVSAGLLPRPTLYLSDYLEQHKSLYFDNLMAVRTKSNLAQWIKFFLVSVAETAKKGSSTFEKILKLKDELESKRIVTLGKKLPKAKQLLDYLWKMPLISATDVEKTLGVTPPTANALIADFVRLGILAETTGMKRNREFVFHKYISLFHS
jgi:Fic family protein